MCALQSRSKKVGMALNMLQANINHCSAAQDLLLHTASEVNADVVIVAEQYRNIRTTMWTSDTTSRAAIYIRGKVPVHERGETVADHTWVRIQ